MKIKIFIIITVFCLIFPSPLTAQKKKNKFKSGGVVALNDSLTSYSQSDIFSFPNVNKLRFYKNQDDLNYMQRLEQSVAEKELYTLLKRYVSNFGIENFSADNAMLWKLARLSEKYGDAGESILLYKLVLKHYDKNTDVSRVRQELDKIDRDKKENYVPLQQYYELVEYRKEIDTLRPPHGVLVKMGEWVNSDKADYGPTIGNLDYLLLFTSKRNSILSIERTYNEDLFFTRKEDGQWTDAQPFKTINTRYNEGSACLARTARSSTLPAAIHLTLMATATFSRRRLRPIACGEM